MTQNKKLEASIDFYRRVALKGQWNNYEGLTVEEYNRQFDSFIAAVRKDAVAQYIREQETPEN